MIPRFQYHEPTTLQETIDILSEYGDRARLLAGGTDLIIQMRRRRIKADHLVSLALVPGLDELQSVNEGFAIGAMVVHRSIERCCALSGPTVALSEASKVVGGHQVRNIATLAGNLCNASPAADTATPLLCLDARVRLAGMNGTRQVSLEAFFKGPGQTVRAPDEVLTQILLPQLPPNTATAFLKAGRRRAMEISIVNVAVRISLDANKQLVQEARIALGAVAPTPIRALAAENCLLGKRLEAKAIQESSRRTVEASRPISDVRASADYRKMLIEKMVERALWKCLERVQGEDKS